MAVKPESALLPLVGSKLTRDTARSEEHTSELQSRLHLVCRLLLEKKKKQRRNKPKHDAHHAAKAILLNQDDGRYHIAQAFLVRETRPAAHDAHDHRTHLLLVHRAH